MKTWIWNHFNLSFKAKDLLSLACGAAGGSHMSLNCLISPSSQELFLATSRNILLLSSTKLRAPSKALSPKTLLDSCVHCFFICEKRRIKNKEMAKSFLWGNENKKDTRKWSKSENVFSYCRGLFSVVLALFATNLSQYVYVSMNVYMHASTVSSGKNKYTNEHGKRHGKRVTREFFHFLPKLRNYIRPRAWGSSIYRWKWENTRLLQINLMERNGPFGQIISITCVFVCLFVLYVYVCLRACARVCVNVCVDAEKTGMCVCVVGGYIFLCLGVFMRLQICVYE